MPPKRKAQKTPRSQATDVVVVDETDEQALRETFDVTSIPMNEDGTSISQQRQQEFRSPSATQKGRGRTGGATKKAVSRRAATQQHARKRAKREDAEENADDEEERVADRATAHPEEAGAADTAASRGNEGGSLAEHTLASLVAAGTAHTATDYVLNVYRRGDQVTALCAILNLVAKASGVQEVELDGNALADGVDISPLLEELYARVPADSAAYLLVNKDAKFRRFRRAFPDFAEKLVRLAWSGDVLLDGVLLPTLAQWVISMSESKSRSFRHTATVMLLGFLQGLNVLYKDLKERLGLSRTKKETMELERNMEEVARWRDHFFSQAIHQRLRDVAPEIRLCVFQSLKTWVLTFREEYMTNKYLRYFGMPLHDKKPELRAEGLDMIWQALYTIPDAYNRMHLFLQYFAGRLVEMSNDVDVRCAELAIRVVAMLVREDSEVAEGNELLKNTMIDRVLLNLFDERPTIRTAAGILLKVFIHCRTAGEETEEEQVKVATELLGSFASTLRTLYEEKMPEKYLIDALWTPERLPLLLTEYKPMLAMAQAAETSTDAVVGLGLLTALLNKTRNRLTLGPMPRDDRRGTAAATARLPQATQETVNGLSRSISQDLGTALGGILERHRGDRPVLAAAAHAVAALDLSVFASGRPAGHLENVLLELRKATLGVCGDEVVRDALVAAWHAVAFTEHPLKASAQAHTAFLLKQILQQLAKAEDAVAAAAAAAAAATAATATTATAATAASARRGSQAVAKASEDALGAWGRMCLISALVPTAESWPVLQAALARQLDRAACGHVAGEEEDGAASDEATARVFEVLELMLGTAVNGALWRVNAHQAATTAATAATGSDDEVGDGAEAAVRANMAEVVACLLQSLHAGDAVLRSGATTAQAATVAAIVSLRTKALVYLCDVAALRYYDMPQGEQESLVEAFDALFEYWAAQLRVAQDVVRTAVSQRGENTILAQVAAARQQSSHVEASQMRLAVGLARLFLFKRLDVALAPRVLVQWTQTSSKAVSDTFKGLLHALRDRAGDAFRLERDTLLTAYARCAEVGATPVSVDALYQVGLKLSSMHFAGTDRYYPTVVAVVQFAAEFAASTDPLLLQGVVPYCNKLHAPDALRLVRQVLAAHDIFMNPTNPYVRAFIAAMRKAAKLEEFLGTSSSSTTTAPQAAGGSSSAARRHRDRIYAVAENERDDHLLAEIVRSVADGSGNTSTSTTAAAAASARVSGSAHVHAAGAGARHGSHTGGKGRVSDAARVVTEDGWRELPASQPVDSDPVSVTLTPQELVTKGESGSTRYDAAAAARRTAGEGGGGGGRRAVVELPTSQEMALSSLADGINTEAFIATEEFE